MMRIFCKQCGTMNTKLPKNTKTYTCKKCGSHYKYKKDTLNGGNRKYPFWLEQPYKWIKE